jgi:hypothetical protein
LRDDALDVGRGQGNGRARALEGGPEPRSRAQQKADEKSPIQIRSLAQLDGVSRTVNTQPSPVKRIGGGFH